MTIFRYVDLGCKKAGAMNVARGKRGRLRGLPSAHPSTCLGVDYNAEYEKVVTEQGYKFRHVRLPGPAFEWPKADVYLAWNFLEHLQSMEEAKQIVRQMIEASRVAVWLLLPSFETDVRRALQARGFDLPWTVQKGHNAFVQKKHVHEAIAAWRQKIKKVEEQPKWPITRCDPNKLRILTGKKQVPGRINPPLIGAWDMLLRLK